MASKYLYNDVMNKWLYINNQNQSSVFADDYDDPTYMTFKIEFGDWGASILDRKYFDNNGTTTFSVTTQDYDALPIGLLNCPYDGCPNAESYWQTNASNDASIFNNIANYSAFTYLRSRNEDTRAKYLYYFVNGLFEIQKETPYLFQKIQGLDSLEAFNPTQGTRLKDAKITLQCIEGINLKIRTLLEFYRKAAWDDVYQRWILPENMREFKMIIYVFERRTFHDAIPAKSSKASQMVLQYGTLNANIPVKAYECYPCEFDIQGSQSWGGEYSSGTDNSAEQSKIVIKVKNVKTYYKNGLLKDTLDKSYKNQGSNTDNLTAKIDSLMIYDLVESIERKGTEDNNDYDSNDTTEKIMNSTISGVRSLFLNKNIILENEDAKHSIAEYVWGQITQSGSKFLSHSISAEEYQNLSVADQQNYKQMPNGKYVQKTIQIDDAYEQGFYNNLNNSSIINYGEGMKILRVNYIGGVVNNILSSVFDKLIGIVKKPFDFHKNMDAIIYDEYHTIRPIVNFKIEKSRKIVKQNFQNLEDFRDLPEQEYDNLEKTRELPEQEYNNLEDSRELPEQEYNNLEDIRELPEQKYKNLEDSRELPEQEYNNLEEIRELPNQKYSNLEDSRELPNQKYNNLEDSREIPNQKFMEMQEEREKIKQDMKTLEKYRQLYGQEYAKLMIAREIPGMKYVTLDDIREIPETDLISLKNTTERSIPKFQIDRQELFDSLNKATSEKTMQLISLDASNIENENIAIQSLRENSTLLNIEDGLDINDNNQTKIAKITKMLALNTEEVKSSYTNSIIDKKKELIKLTKDVIRELPEMTMYKLENNDQDNKQDMAMISLTDIDYIQKNIHLISIPDEEYRQLSFGTLLSLEETIIKQIDETKKVIGLSNIAIKNNDKEITNYSENRKLGNKNMKMISMQEENEKAGRKKSMIVY